MAGVADLVGELSEVLAELGLASPARTGGVRVLDDIDAKIAPARLPPAVRAVWESLDPARLEAAVSTYPQLSTPEFGLTGWEQRHADGFDPMLPRHFFQLCYSSHDTMWVECDGADWEGGCLFESFISDPGSPFTLRYRSIEDWLEVLIATLREAAFEETRPGHVMLDNERNRQLAAAKLVTYGPDPVLGARTEIPIGHTAWPAEWRRRSGLEPDETIPEEDLRTIAQVLRDSRSKPVQALVRARVVRAYNHFVIHDPTGQLQVAPPPKSRPQPSVGSEYVFELQLPTRGEPTPPLREPSYYMNPYVESTLAKYKMNADATTVKAQLASEGQPTRQMLPPVTTGVIFWRLPDSFANPRLNNEPWPEVGSVTDLLQAIPGLLTRFMPPREILNDLLRRGRVEAGLLPGCAWSPFELTPDAYAAQIEELEFEGTQVAPLEWGQYQRPDLPRTVTTYPDYLEWRNWLPEAPRLDEDELEAQLRKAQDALGYPADDPGVVATRQLELWDAQRAVVLRLRELWRSDHRVLGARRRDQLGGQMLAPALDAFIAQKALWFATRARQLSRIEHARGALAEAQRGLADFLATYGPGGTSPAGFDHPPPPEVRERYTELRLFGLPEPLWPAAPHRGVKRYRSKWEPPYNGLIAGDLSSATVEYGDSPSNFLIVETSREWNSNSNSETPINRAFDAMALAVMPRTSSYERQKIAGRPDDRLLARQIWHNEARNTTERWIVDGNAYETLEFRSEKRNVFGVVIGLPDVMIIVAGTTMPRRRELITLTDLKPYDRIPGSPSG